MLPQQPLPTKQGRALEGPTRWAGDGGTFYLPPPPLARHIGNPLVTLVPKPVPIPRPIGAAGAAAALEGTSRLEHSDSHGPRPCLQPLGGLRRRWLGCATDRAQHHLCPPSPVEDFGKGWGWMGLVLCQTRQSTGVRLIRHVSMAPRARWDVLLGLLSEVLTN